MMLSSRQISVRTVALTALLGGGLLWAYWPVLAEMAGKWFNNPQYSHAYLVPAFSAYLLWQGRERLSGATLSPAWWGLAPLLVGIALRLGGAYVGLGWFEAVSLLPVLAGAALLLGGWAALRWSWVAIAFLAFMIPLPYRVETGLSGPLQQVATYISAYSLQTMGWPAFTEGNVILLNESRIGVVEACNGLGMMLLFFALATGVALVIDRPWPDRVLLVLSAAPIAVVANVARIVSTSVLYETAGKRCGDLVFHDLAGWLMMPLALSLLCLELKLISLVLVERPAEEDAAADFSGRPGHGLEQARA
jgi:exosortase